MINGLKAEGENKENQLSEVIWELTPGELTNSGWWSSKTKNHQDLVEKGSYFDMEIKRRGNKMTIAVPTFISNIKYAKGDVIDTYLIRFFNNESKSNAATNFIICNQVKILRLSHMDFSRISRSSKTANYKEVLMELKGGYQFQ